MGELITTYINGYFGIKVSFPENWPARANSASPESKMQYQLTDDDLPIDEGDFRTLVNAMRRGRGQHKIISGEFLIGIYKKSGGYDLSESKPYNEGIIERRYGSQSILGQHAQTMDTIEQGENYQWLTKTLCYETQPNIWLTIYIAGDCAENFAEAEKLLDRITLL